LGGEVWRREMLVDVHCLPSDRREEAYAGRVGPLRVPQTSGSAACVVNSRNWLERTSPTDVHVLMYPCTTVEPSGPVWPHCQDTGIAYQADRVTPGSGRL